MRESCCWCLRDDRIAGFCGRSASASRAISSGDAGWLGPGLPALTWRPKLPNRPDPHKRIPDMDLDGIDAAFLYPSMGLFAGAVHEPELAAAFCRAYNRSLTDY